MRKLFFFLYLFVAFMLHGNAEVTLGIDRLINEEAYFSLIKGKRVGLVTNHTAVNASFFSSYELLKTHANLVALFAPEHGLKGHAYANEKTSLEHTAEGLPIYSLHGETKRPNDKMLKGIDVLVYDIQDIGTRSYTYTSTLFYLMEEAAKHKIPVIVCDRPNPLGGIVDGPLLDTPWRSFLGYVRIPYCHGMTVGELARLFKGEYGINCLLHVVPMKGWKRIMGLKETGLPWVPTSPQIPEADTPFFYPMTGILGEMKLVNIGIGYTLPFKIVGAPWIKAEEFASALNKQQFRGVHFQPFHYRPFFGAYKGKDCQGVRIIITDEKELLPVTTQYLILGVLKSLYPHQFQKSLETLDSKKELFCRINGTDKVWKITHEEKYISYPLRQLCEEARREFLPIRKKYLEKTYE